MKPVLVHVDPGQGFFPCQWYGRLRDGRQVYGRYRHGELSVTLGDTERVVVSTHGQPCDDGNTWCCDRCFVAACADVFDVVPEAVAALHPCPGQPASWMPPS